MEFKNSLRKKILTKRKKFFIHKFHTENELILENINIVINSLNNNVLGLYLALSGEPNLDKIAMLYNGHSIALPKVAGGLMQFVHYKIGDKLEKTENGFWQPISNIELNPNIIIVPGLAYSIKGYRLGFGRGYYDKYLASKKNLSSIKIGVCFDEFLLEYIPNEKHDIKFDYIITDKMILKL